MVAKTISITTYSQKLQLEEKREHWKNKNSEAYNFENTEINHFKKWSKEWEYMIENNISRAKSLYDKIKVYWNSSKDSFIKRQNHQSKELNDSLNYLKKSLKIYSEKQSQDDNMRILEWFDCISKLNNEKFQEYKDQILTILVDNLSSFTKSFEQIRNSYKHKIEEYHQESKEFNEYFKRILHKSQDVVGLVIDNQKSHLWVILFRLISIEEWSLNKLKSMKRFQ